MGYSITIGEFEISENPDDGIDCSCLSFGAESKEIDSAPAFGEPTDRCNMRWPSYSVWSDCLEHAGMKDLFFCEQGHLIGGHPGVRLITSELYSEFTDRKVAFEAKYPKVEATYGNQKSNFEGDPDNPECNSTYCRIIWLDYWLSWALRTCNTPVIANS